MTKRALFFALTRPKVLILAGIGTALLWWGAPVMAAAIVYGVATIKVARTLSHPDLDDRLRLQEQKHAHGIHRLLSPGEREEILAIDHYCKLLKEMGASPELADETMHQTWLTIRANGRTDSTAQLKVFRHDLPPLRQPDLVTASQPEGVSRQIERELNLMRAAKREIELIG